MQINLQLNIQFMRAKPEVDVEDVEESTSQIKVGFQPSNE